MILYKSIVAYDGTDFAGFQRQGQGERTVQDDLEAGLRALGWEEGSLLAAGRTDAGVHAQGQVIGFRLSWNQATPSITLALNANLPRDLSVLSTEAAPEGFHPRFSAKRRCYRYRMVFDSSRQPLQERYAWRVWPKPDERAMCEAAEILLGEHDFGGFGRAPVEGGQTRRQMFKVGVSLTEDLGDLEFIADAFLYHMVRRLTAGLVEIGWGKRSVAELSEVLLQPTRKWEGRIAPAHGLCLESVEY
jgi:tRNA pseudouridine38-40 synthase